MCSQLLWFVVLGIVLDAFLSLTPLCYLAAVLMFLLATAWKRAFLFGVVVALSALNAALQKPGLSVPMGRQLSFSGTVVSEEPQMRGIKLTVMIERLYRGRDNLAFRLPVECYTHRRQTYLGRRVTLTGSITPARSAYGLNGFRGTVKDEGVDGDFMPTVFYTVRRHIDQLFQSCFRPSAYNLACGLVLGGSSRAGEEVKTVFSRAGVLHILSVSGLHVGFLISFISLILMAAPVPSFIRYLITMAVLFIYAGITGFLPTVVRAGLMAAMFGLAYVLERNVDSLHIVNVTALILLIIAPGMLMEMSAQLSFASIYGIVIIYPHFNTKIIDRLGHRALKTLCSMLGISVAAQIFVTPLIIHYFQRLPTMACFSNLLVVPLSTAITYLLFTMTITGLFSGIITRGLGYAGQLLLQGLVAVCRFFANLPWSTVRISISPLLLIGCYFLWHRSSRRPAFWAMLAINLILSIAALPACTIFEFGKTGTMVKFSNGQQLLITRDRELDLRRFGNIEKLDFLIAPVKICEPQQNYFSLPNEHNFKQIQIGDLTVIVDREITIRWAAWTVNLDRLALNESEIRYAVVKGDYWGEFKGARNGSVLTEVIWELKMIWFKIRAWLG